MAILTRPTDEELALFAILTDPSGIDLGELLVEDPEQDHGRWRFRDYQWPWLKSDEARQIDHSSRDLGKSASIVFRAMAHPFNYKGQQMAIVTPQQKHLTDVAEKIEYAIKSNWLLTEMLRKPVKSAITRKNPFRVNFANGSFISGHIPQLNNLGVKGCVAEGTLVLTERGHRPVQDLRPGEHIWTASGRWLPLTYLSEDENECVRVRGRGFDVTASKDHRFLGRARGGREEPAWHCVDELIPDDVRLCSPRRRRGWRLRKVTSVEEVGLRRVFNPVTEDPEGHSYLSNGVVSHNIHAAVLVIDEAQDLAESTWKELVETGKRHVQNAVYLVHGVTRGVRGKFYDFTQPNSGWRIHRYVAPYRPTWDDKERQEKIQEYGGSPNDPDYRRNVFGFHGQETEWVFVQNRLYACIDDEEASEYNTEVYQEIRISAERVLDAGGIEHFLDFRRLHKKRWKTFWVGMDIGVTNAPSEILLFGEEAHKDGVRYRLLLRIHMERVKVDDQLIAMLQVLEHYRPKVFALDRGGVGITFFQLLEKMAAESDTVAELKELVKGYDFGEKIQVRLPDEDVEFEDEPTKRELFQNTKEISTDYLRNMVDDKRIVLPWDRELIGEWEGQTVTRSLSMNHYGHRVFSSGHDHTLDGGRFFALAVEQYALEVALKERKRKKQPVSTSVIFVRG